MSLFEWLGESVNPGPTGRTEIGARTREAQPRILVLLRGFIALTLVALLFGMLAGPMGIREYGTHRNVAVGLGVYCFFAYFIHPEPDESNMGWAGGLLDDPTRISDDHNRFLFFLKLALSPGRFLAEAFVDTIGLLWAARRGEKPPSA